MASNYINVWYVYKKSLPSITYYAVKIEQPTASINGPLRDYLYLIRQKIFDYLSTATSPSSYANLKTQVSSLLSSDLSFQETEFQRAILKLYLDNVVVLSNSTLGSISGVYTDGSFLSPGVSSYLTNANTLYRISRDVTSYTDSYIGNFYNANGEVKISQAADRGTVKLIEYFDKNLLSLGTTSSLYIGDGQTSSNNTSDIIMARYTRAEKTVTIVSSTALPIGLVGKTLYFEFTPDIYLPTTYTRVGGDLEVTYIGHDFPVGRVVIMRYPTGAVKSYLVSEIPSDNLFKVPEGDLTIAGGSVEIRIFNSLLSVPTGEYEVKTQSLDLKTITVEDGSISTGDTSKNITSNLDVIIRRNYLDISVTEFTVNSLVSVKRLLPELNPDWDPLLSTQQEGLNPENLPVTPGAAPSRDASTAKFIIEPSTGAPKMTYYTPKIDNPDTHHVFKVYGSKLRALHEARLVINTSSINGVQVEYPEGTYYKYHPNGYLSQEYSYRKLDNFSFLSGPFIEYYQNGETRCQGNFSITNENKPCDFVVDTVNRLLRIFGLDDHIVKPKDSVRITINGINYSFIVEEIPSTDSLVMKIPSGVNLPEAGSAQVTTYDSVMDGQYFEFFISGANKSRCNIVRGRVQGDVYQWDEEGNREYVVLGIEDGTFTENTVVLNYTFTY